jgi:hypothetical protein
MAKSQFAFVLMSMALILEEELREAMLMRTGN